MSRVREVVGSLGEVAGRRVRKQERCGLEPSFARISRVLNEKEWQPCWSWLSRSKPDIKRQSTAKQTRPAKGRRAVSLDDCSLSSQDEPWSNQLLWFHMQHACAIRTSPLLQPHAIRAPDTQQTAPTLGRCRSANLFSKLGSFKEFQPLTSSYQALQSCHLS